MERQLAIDAIAHLRRWGGVLEHPAGSTLWAHRGMPTPGRAPDRYGGWTAEIRQCDWGHKAEKLTWLYIVGCHPDELPEIPPRAEPTHVINHCLRAPDGRLVRKGHPGWRPEVSKAGREHTPPDLAVWLVEVARRCRVELSEAA